MKIPRGLRQSGVLAALGTAPLFGSGTPLSKQARRPAQTVLSTYSPMVWGDEGFVRD